MRFFTTNPSDKRTRKSSWLILVIFLLGAISANAQAQRPWWHSLEQGKLSFRSMDYGNALLSFEDARRQRRAMFERMEQDFINVLSIIEVRRIGDSLDLVERYIYERRHTAAAAALEELYYRVPKASLGNSAASALEAFGKLKDYPEAEYWIGETFRVEGELALALSQYRKAYAQREFLENSGFDTDLQYKIAAILKTRQEYNEMEKILLSVIADSDTLWTNAAQAELASAAQRQTGNIPYVKAEASFASQAMTSTLENEGINRFLTLYRYDNNLVLEAHRLLGYYYAVSGRPSAQQHLMFAFLIQNSTIISELIRRQYDYTFTSLAALADDINRIPILSSYAQETEYFKTAYYLAASLYRNGKSGSARDIWTFLAAQSGAGEWQGRALAQVRNPRLDPIVEMP